MLGRRGGLTSTISIQVPGAESIVLVAVPGGYGFFVFCGGVGGNVGFGVGAGGCDWPGAGGVGDGPPGLPDGEPLGLAA